MNIISILLTTFFSFFCTMAAGHGICPVILIPIAFISYGWNEKLIPILIFISAIISSIVFIRNGKTSAILNLFGTLGISFLAIYWTESNYKLIGVITSIPLYLSSIVLIYIAFIRKSKIEKDTECSEKV
jgi:hypothetical protein